MKVPTFFACLLGLATASYFDANNCKDTTIILPSNATTGIIYTIGRDNNPTELVYENFKSELEPGTSTTTAGNEYIMRNGDASLNCGQWVYTFAIANTEGQDVSSQYSSIFTYDPVAFPDIQDASTTTHWKVTIDNTAVSTTFSDQDVVVLTLVGTFAHPSNSQPNWPQGIQTTPYVVMAPIEVPLDLSMITEPLNTYIPLIDVALQRFFWEFFAIFVSYNFGYIPIALAGLLILELIFAPILFIVLIGINLPLAIILGFYFYNIYTVAEPMISGDAQAAEESTTTDDSSSGTTS